MKVRRHHNNKGRQKIKSGNNERQLQRIAKKLRIPFGVKNDHPPR